MADTQSDTNITVGRFYTSARKFQQRLGALPDGTKIPGGPYTYTQVGVMVGVVILGWLTRGVWGGSNGLFDLIGLVAVAWGAGWLVAKAPRGKRSVLSLVSSTFALLKHPGAGGRYKGQPIRLTQNAMKIHRQHKKQAKKKTQICSPDDETQRAEPTEPPMPAGYGSSLNRLLQEHGLS